MSVYLFAKELIRDSGAFIRGRMEESFQVERKSNPNDLVTTVDLENEQYIRTKIKEAYPNHNIIGEEYEADMEDSKVGYLWVIDPIDGTLNFVHQRENFAISIGIYKDGEPYAGLILDVMKDKLIHAEAGNGAFVNDEKLSKVKTSHLSNSIVGISHKWLVREDIKGPLIEIVKKCRSPRSLGSAALEYVQLIEGRIEASMFFRLSPWDFSAGKIIGKEVGIITTDFLGRENEWLERTSVLATNSVLQKELLEIMKNDEGFILAHDKFHNIHSSDH
ncbi:inositol monophosphatase family protein [Phocicoccus pinnipedialis]|uniref:Inositol-1-monophosphatase n=1 Tax=Phocicoccus pinnipedialis TaxID=110845 RepID=A0A6V7RIM3_9BACL|nr:inositol monophosphatase family protein [Jeotgalicoccus pinnipedialis]MBP1939005.1 myo-inositol-1(or 4)-monophosphatase [Jeotgalicoccus pinnipedialis]CAD2077214.1 Inositol-1-monophosphatase [Jeotgalicoccus pinnipedialis]